MPQMYRIFVNEKPLTLQNQPSKTGKSYLFESEHQFDEVLHILSNSEELEFTLYASDLDDLWFRFRNHYTIIKAGGGWVLNPENEVLFIQRFQKWDLPKGKRDPGEKMEQTALREVQEECGISGLERAAFIDYTYHIYFQKKWILKETYWYSMRYSGNEQLIPQEEEGIEEVIWAKKEKIPKLLETSYANLIYFIEKNNLL